MPLWVKMLATISLLPPENERQQTVNSLCAGVLTYTETYCIVLYRNQIFNHQSFLYVFVYHFTTMYAMSHRGNFVVARSSRVDNQELAIFSTLPYLLTSCQFPLPSDPIPTTMSGSQSLNTTSLEVMISFKNDHGFIHDLNDLTQQVIFDAWWASINVGSKHSIAWKNARHEPSWQFYLHCGIGETGRPGIICIVCHQVLRHQSEHGTSSMG